MILWLTLVKCGFLPANPLFLLVDKKYFLAVICDFSFLNEFFEGLLGYKGC
jgi:hypothetical protein